MQLQHLTFVGLGQKIYYSTRGKLMKMEAEDSNLCDFALIEKDWKELTCTIA
uniref:HDC03334 n=1 Tax=Drosophila melanogaster TaxID=7227 RepID=Q6IH49_DROME|nr:TPA_inf: HDC03334 [Drosophila melanogaster]